MRALIDGMLATWYNLNLLSNYVFALHNVYEFSLFPIFVLYKDVYMPNIPYYYAGIFDIE